MMTNCACEGQIFLSHPHINNGFFFLLTTKYLILENEGKMRIIILIFKLENMKKASKYPEYPEMRHDDVVLTLQ